MTIICVKANQADRLALWLTLAALRQNSPGVSHICYSQVLTNQNCGDSCAAIISVGT